MVLLWLRHLVVIGTTVYGIAMVTSLSYYLYNCIWYCYGYITSLSPVQLFMVLLYNQLPYLDRDLSPQN